MNITLDITGMYYRTVVDVPEGATVFDVMIAAQGQVARDGGGIMTFTALDSQGNASPFINLIAVDYGVNSAPVSRQSGASRVQGKYSYDDNKGFLPPQNSGDISLQLAWQYYITANDKTIKNVGIDGTRAIVPARNSNQGAGAIQLADGDTITWRLVGIFGLTEAAMKSANAYIMPAGSARELK